MVWQRETAVIHPGGALIMYSDGVTEAQNQEQAEFGEARLLAALQGETAREMGTAVLAAIHDFVGDAPQFDDVTLVITVRQKTLTASPTAKLTTTAKPPKYTKH
jgi:sigma-B regulation protein RsbU (phosphoserine phosphatase)